MRVYFHTFGCKANQYDTEVVRQALEDAGAATVADPAGADIAVVNSCTVTHTGEAKMRTFVRGLHRRRPALRTVIMGCAAAVDDGTLTALPGVTAVVGGGDPDDVLRALDVDPSRRDPVLRSFSRGARAWLKVQDGCDEHCTFCATTVARGENRSRDPAELVAEATGLAEAHAEIVLTGVHIGTYGRDRGDGVGLSGLLERLVREVPRVRFRLSSVEATEVDPALEALMVEAPERLAPHLHAPLQSGSDRVLRRMGRHWYTADTYRARCEALATRLPVLGLGADVIVGFPGETDADFAATRALVEALPYTYLHVFPYSPRPDAPARRLGAPVAPETTRARATALRDLVARKRRAYERRRQDTWADVVVIGRREGRAQALTEDYLDTYVSTEDLPAPRFRGTLEVRGEAGPLWITRKRV